MLADDASVTKQALTPVQPAERVEIIDILRGFALFGILLVNMELFIHPIQRVILPLEATVSEVDRVADWIVRFLAEGKFYSLFSFLFGLGFAILLARAEQRGVRLWGPYTRRLVTLFVIGLLHAYLIWVGDILTLYAFLGFVLTLFRKAKPKTLLIWAVVIVSLPLVLTLLGVVGMEMGRRAGPDVAAQIEQSFAQQDSVYRAELARADSVYPQGGFAEITAQRARDMSFMAFGNLFLAPGVFAMFLAGLYFGRRRVFYHIEENLSLFRRLLWWGLSLGVIGNLIYATLIQSLSRAQPTFSLLAAMLGQAVGAPALCLFYVSALTLLCRRAVRGRIFGMLGSVGRLPLTNYLGESIICTLIFYGYGFGLFGQVGKALGLVLAVLIYVGLALLSTWWTGRFRFGPVEWLWRSITYLKLQPMRSMRDGTT